MPTIQQPNHRIVSDTKYIRMIAFRDGPIEGTDREWYLTVNMSGASIEFLACEGLRRYMVTREDALTRITEFEANMKAENQGYVQNIIKGLLKRIPAIFKGEQGDTWPVPPEPDL